MGSCARQRHPSGRIAKSPGHSGHSESALLEVDPMTFRHLYSSGLFSLSSTEVGPSGLSSQSLTRWEFTWLWPPPLCLTLFSQLQVRNGSSENISYGLGVLKPTEDRATDLVQGSCHIQGLLLSCLPSRTFSVILLQIEQCELVWSKVKVHGPLILTVVLRI